MNDTLCLHCGNAEHHHIGPRKLCYGNRSAHLTFTPDDTTIQAIRVLLYACVALALASIVCTWCHKDIASMCFGGVGIVLTIIAIQEMRSLDPSND